MRVKTSCGGVDDQGEMQYVKENRIQTAEIQMKMRNGTSIFAHANVSARGRLADGRRGRGHYVDGCWPVGRAFSMKNSSMVCCEKLFRLGWAEPHVLSPQLCWG